VRLRRREADKSMPQKEPPRRVGKTPSPTRSRQSRNAESESLKLKRLPAEAGRFEGIS